MCGIAGVATVVGRGLSVERAGVVAMRDRLAHRGPDGQGLWWGGHVALGHRRLAVVGLGEGGAQPMESACGGHVLVYNGELYNDGAIRADLEREGSGSGRTGTDTETVLRALACWGEREGAGGAMGRLRGMYALAWYDRARRVLTLGRDPLGIKPLVWWRGAVPGGGEEVVFASEVAAVLAHPHVRALPDWTVTSAYLTTIRTTLGSRTMFEGVRTLQPGEWIEFDLSGERIVERSGAIGVGAWGCGGTGLTGVDRTREVVGESVRLHLRSDVPLCALLSGGLDSTIVCAEARRHVGALHSYCAGASAAVGGPAIGPGAALSPDFSFARLAAERLGTTHREAEVTRGGFGERWEWMVSRLGVPLSTPNEVAIYEVSASLRGAGHVVALSGEGADELFGGYDRLLAAASAWVAGGGGAEEGGRFAMESAAWVPLGSKEGFLRPVVWEAVEHDAAVVETYRDVFGACVGDAAGDGWMGSEGLMQAFLRMQRRVNLSGLLARLDGATMLAGVEGRTPLADVGVARLAEQLPMELKFVPGEARPASVGHRTKIALRTAFADLVPPEILAREKASFPLPFQAWLEDRVGVLEGSGITESLFEPGAINLVRGSPSRAWGLAWPMLNLAMWGRRWGW